MEVRNRLVSERVAVRVECLEESRTKQEFKDECDINLIMSRYARFGTLPSVNAGSAMYGDFSAVGDLLEAQSVVERAREQFDGLPSKIRDRFDNDPVKFLTFMGDPSKKEEAIALGILNAPPKEEPPKNLTPPGEPNIPKKKVDKNPKK